MKEFCGNHFILNGALKQVEEFDNSLVYKGDTIYEVIRMVKGIPVFFEDHVERLASSVEIQKRRMITDAAVLKQDIIRLTGVEKRKEINIKVVFNYNEDAENYLIYYIDSGYPSPEYYKKGVKGILFWGERKDPHSKLLNYRMKSAIHQELMNEDAYEALLVNSENLITEGSKSNVFFLKQGKLITAPDECILKGVTRKHILEICREQNIPVEFSCVNADEIGDYEAAFMTGTSPMVLPYCCINDTWFDVSHPLMEELRKLYMERVEKSLLTFTTELH